MNKILQEIKNIIKENISLYLPHAQSSDLEKNGAIFYMNGKDGTEFDWYVNDKIPPFMSFYNDKDNLGIAKLLLFNNGSVELYLYAEQGKKHIKTIHTNIDASTEQIFILAVTLKNEADDKRLWDKDIEEINTDINIDKNQINLFRSRQENYISLKNRKKILNQNAYVSKKIIEEGYKVGYMERAKPYNEVDSGWYFGSGTEDDAYLNNYKNIMLVPVGIVWQQFDTDIFKYINMEVGSKLVRVSPNEFEVDRGTQNIYILKR